MCMSTCGNAVRHLLCTRYSKFSKVQSEPIYFCPNPSLTMLGMETEHEINVLEESYCIHVCSCFTFKTEMLLTCSCKH